MIAIDNTAYPAKTLVSWFWRKYVRKRLPLILLATLLMSLEGGTLGLLSYMVRPLFDEIFLGGQRESIFFISAIVFAVFIGRAIVGFLQRYLMAYTARNMSADLQMDLVRHLLTLDISVFRINSPGVLIERVRGDSGAAISIVSTTFSAMGRDVMALVSLLAVAMSIDWLWTVLALVGAPVILVPVVILQKFIRKTSRVVRDAAARITTRLDEIFHGISTIKLNTTEKHEITRFETEIRKMVQAGLQLTAASAGIPALMDIVAAIGFLGVLMYGGLQVIDGAKTVGEFMSFFTAMALVFEPMRRLGKISGAWQKALVSMERVYGVFQQIPTITSPAKPVEMTALPEQADVVFTDVSFDYGEQSILCDISFRARAGETTALVGASGAGKSTVFNVLTRLVDAAAGQVTIGDTDICALKLEDLRSIISVVTQDTQLFDETIRENILLGKPAADEQLLTALDAAHVSDFLPNLSDGVDTRAGPRGSGLSGGQRQRVAIARALLRDTPILLLDEATSALDAKSEAIVQDALDRLSKGRTTLVIAHRLATVRGADNIIVMDQGRIVDQGTHDELIKRDGIYSGLYQLQFAETS